MAVAGMAFEPGPVDLPRKYPEMDITVPNYAQGQTVMEALWKGTLAPWQVNFAGDPLASPFPLAISAPSVASFGAVVEAGSWASLYGSNLADGTTAWNGDFPTSLVGTTVTIEGNAAYLAYVSPGQINLQVPDDTALGPVPLVVTTRGGSTVSTATLASFAPAFFLSDATHVAGPTGPVGRAIRCLYSAPVSGRPTRQSRPARLLRGRPRL